MVVNTQLKSINLLTHAHASMKHKSHITKSICGNSNFDLKYDCYTSNSSKEHHLLGQPR